MVSAAGFPSFEVRFRINHLQTSFQRLCFGPTVFPFHGWEIALSHPCRVLIRDYLSHIQHDSSDQQIAGTGVSGEVRRIRRFPRFEPRASLPAGSATATDEYSA